MKVPDSWKILRAETEAEYFRSLERFVERERLEHQVYPDPEHVFESLTRTPYASVRVVILGQDPYHGADQAHGLSFSVQAGVKIPPSLRNIFKELTSDLGHPAPEHGNLSRWAEQGVLLLNTVLTVRANAANSHRKQGWEPFTDAVIQAVSARAEPIVFLLWGNPAQKKRKLIDVERHVIIESAHPSPLSAYRGFLGSRPFSKVNAALVAAGGVEIDWRLP